MKYYFISALLLSSSSLLADTICGDDGRNTISNHRIGRLTYKNAPACTVTMIGKECAVSAGHCTPFLAGGIVEFDVPLSNGSQIRNSDPKNTYLIDPATIASDNREYGRDWTVFKLKANAVTKAFAGTVNGYYPVNTTFSKTGTAIQIAGYGLDNRDILNTNGVLQIAYGKVTEISEYNPGDGSNPIVLNHNVNTEEGDSGAVIVRVKEQDIIAIHTHGRLSCSLDDNKGTLISENKKLKEAIQNCLK